MFTRKHALAASVVLIPAAALLSHAATAAPAASVVLKARLTGSYLHTTSKGSGTVTITFTGSKACWKFSYSGLDTPGDSGIHIAPPPAAGVHKTSVFPFTASTSTAPGCVADDHFGRHGPGWVAKITADPGRYYVIVGTTQYPQGAIGGPLHGA
jgi:hypothetical protein